MFSAIYRTIVGIRNTLYDRGVFKSHLLGVPVVSIGNLTVGGTGKTPLVALAAGILAGKGEKVCIISRGYGRENPKTRVLISDWNEILVDVKRAGDEPYELARKLSGKAIIVADADRVAAGIWAREKFGITAFVLDDAFQHRRVKRSVDIVCVDATNPFGNGKTLPTGILRESIKNLNRADAVVITRANLSNDVSKLESEIAKQNPNCPIFISENKLSGFVVIKNFLAEKNEISIENRNFSKAFAFCALGNPENFFEQLRRENVELVGTKIYSDHHFYAEKDIAVLEKLARAKGAEMLITTAKDAVKLGKMEFGIPCFVAVSETFFPRGDFEDWLLKKIAG